jgi:5'-methylthioadenosine phosphorylase
MKNAGYAQLVAAAAVRLLGAEKPESAAHTALATSLVTQPADMTPEVLARLQVLWTD